MGNTGCVLQPERCRPVWLSQESPFGHQCTSPHRGQHLPVARYAVVRHLTQDLTPGKRRTRENYFSFRNSIFLFYRFGSWADRSVLWKFLLKRFLSRAYSFRSKILFAFALVDHIRYIPYLLQTRDFWGNSKHPWVRLTETSLSR